MGSLPIPANAAESFSRFLIAKHISFNVVESYEFKDFWQRFVGGHKAPTRQNASTQYLDSLYEAVLKEAKERCESITNIALTTDGWTGLSTSYWSLTAQGLDSDFNLHHFKLGCRPIFAPVHRAAVIGEEIKKVLKEFGIPQQKISAVVTDEGGAAPLIAAQFESADEIHCGAHLLNTTLRIAFQQISSEMPIVSLVMDACRDLAGASNRSTQMREQLIANQLASEGPVTTMKQSVSTRWNSLLNNIKSVLSSKQAILSLCAANPKLTFSGVILHHGDLFWELLRCFKNLLEPFETATKEMCADNTITADCIVANYLGLREMLADPKLFQHENPLEIDRQTMEEAFDVAQRCAKIVVEKLEKKFEPLQEAEIIAFALNPNFRIITNPVTDYDHKWNDVLNTAYELIEKSGRSEIQPKVVEEEEVEEKRFSSNSVYKNKIQSGVSKHNTHSTEEAIVLELRQFKGVQTSQSNLGSWWKINKRFYPLLAKIALRYLSMPASQSASERDFSQMRLMCTHLRNTLNPMKAYKLSVVGPFLRRNRPGTRPRSMKNMAADVQRVDSTKQQRLSGLKRRFASITPNPFPPLGPPQEDLESEYLIDVPDDDNGEHQSDIDYTDDQESLSADHEISEADDDFEHLQPVRQVPKLQEMVPIRRRDRVTCELRQSTDERYRYLVTFNNLKNRAPPTLQALFGEKFIYIQDWAMLFSHDTQYWTFVASEVARKKWTSGKQFLRELGEIIDITDEMMSYYN